MPLEFFTVEANLSAIVIDYVDAGTDPDVQKISATVDFIPRLPRGSLVWAPGLEPPQGVALPTIRARFDTDGYLRTPAGGPINAQQTVTITGSPPPGATITYGFKGQTTTVDYNANTNAMDAAFEALSTVGANNITVGGTPGSSYVVSFTGALGASPQPLLTAITSWGGGTAATVATTRTGTLGAGVKLTANTAAIDLDYLIYDVSFKNVVFNKSDQFLAPFGFVAPTAGGVTVDLSTVQKIPPAPDTP